MAQALVVDGIQAVEPAFEKIGALRGEHDAGLLAAGAGIDIGARQNLLQGRAREVGVLGVDAPRESRCCLARRGFRLLLDAGAGLAQPAQVGRERPGDERDALAAHAIGERSARQDAEMAVHVGDRDARLAESAAEAERQQRGGCLQESASVECRCHGKPRRWAPLCTSRGAALVARALGERRSKRRITSGSLMATFESIIVLRLGAAPFAFVPAIPSWTLTRDSDSAYDEAAAWTRARRSRVTSLRAAPARCRTRNVFPC